jgi:Ricin-type beta-trefoil lectin domain-like
MRNRRLIILCVAVAATTAVGVAAPSPAHTEDAIVKILSVENAKCLQPINGSPNQGDAIVQQPYNGSVAQQWTVKPVSSTKVHLVNRSSNLCLDARAKAVNGTPIQQWTCNWISNENWSFGITNNLLSSGVSNTFSHCIATPGAHDGLAMELRFCSGNPAQLWNRPNG